MKRRDITTNDPFRGVPNPTADERVIEIMTDDDVRAIIATTDGPGFLNRRDRALFHLAADCGLRRSEMAAALLSDLDLTTGRLILRGTKAGRDRMVPLSDRTRMEMRRYLKERERIVGDDDPLTLFVSRTGSRLTGWGVHRIFVTRAREAKVEVDRPVHGWRAWFAVTALANGANESAVMSVAGWRESGMLRRYTKGRAQELALKAHASFSPVRGL
jgi:site-specific recombinase XerD